MQEVGTLTGVRRVGLLAHWRQRTPLAKPLSDVRRRQLLQMTDLGRAALQRQGEGEAKPVPAKEMTAERRRLLQCTTLGKIALRRLEDKGNGGNDGR